MSKADVTNEDVFKAWKTQFPIFVKKSFTPDRWAKEDIISQDSWTQEVISPFVRGYISPILGLPCQEQVVYYEHCLKKNVRYDYLLGDTVCLEHENASISDISGEFHKLKHSPVRVVCGVGYGTKEEVECFVADILEPAVLEALSKDPSHQWLFIFGIEKEGRAVVDPADWVAYGSRSSTSLVRF
jgi:hypothetical protein